MAKQQAGRDFSGPAQKYAGKVKIGGGPVPIECWYRPLTRAERDHPQGAEGTDLRPEREPKLKEKISGTPKGTAYNRQSSRGNSY